jgi:hypothetical protein
VARKTSFWAPYGHIAVHMLGVFERDVVRRGHRSRSRYRIATFL